MLLLWSNHPLRTYPGIKLLGRDITQGERGGPESGALLVRLLGDLRRLVVADVRVERGHQHERVTHQLGDALAPRLDAGSAVLVEARGAVGEQPYALQEIVDDEGLEYVQLEMSRGTADIDRNVVAQHLRAQHGHRFRLRGVDLARHDRAARLVFRDGNLADSGARPAREPAHVVRDLGERSDERLH